MRATGAKMKWGGGIYPYTQQYAQCVSCKQDSHNNFLVESHGVCVVFIEKY